MTIKQPVPTGVVERILLRPDEAAQAIGISRSKMYDLIARRKIPFKRVGASARISVDELRKWAARASA